MNAPSEAQSKASARVAQEFAHTLFASQQEQALKHLFNKDQLKQIEDWIKRQAEPLDRPEAIRRLVELGLSASEHCGLLQPLRSRTPDETQTL